MLIYSHHGSRRELTSRGRSLGEEESVLCTNSSSTGENVTDLADGYGSYGMSPE
jgi:hypothetical protein